MSAAVSVVAIGVGAFSIATPAASAAGTSPWWHLTQRVVPSHIEPGGEGTIDLQAINVGDSPTTGNYQFTDQLPAGLTLVSSEFYARPSKFLVESEQVLDTNRPDFGPGGAFSEYKYCQQAADSLTCSSQHHGTPFEPTTCEEVTGSEEACDLQPIVPFDFLVIKLTVKAEAGFGPGQLESNQLSVTGGGAPPAHLARPVTLSTAPASFGLEHFALTPEAEGGSVATRAGSHPYQLTADVAFNRAGLNSFKGQPLPRNLHFNLPAGQLGNPTVTPKCSATDFAHVGGGGEVNLCPANTALGATIVTVAVNHGTEESTFTAPIFNLETAPGEPARFGFEVLRNPVILDTHLRSGNGEDYGVTADVSNITQLVGFFSATNVFWGAPASPAHDESRGWGCIRNGFSRIQFEEASGEPLPCESTGQKDPVPFLTLPANCAAPFSPLFEGLSWPLASAPGGIAAPPLSDPLADEAGNLLSLTGCNQVPFDPQIHSEPTSNAATSPTGLSFEIDFHDEGLLASGGIAQSQMKRAVVTLPQGFTTNPSVAEGLKACSQAQYESETAESPPGAGCPNESKVGDVVIESPLVEEKVPGSLYVAQQGQNPNANLLTIYLVAKNAKLGVVIKQALRVTPDPVTGQLTTEVDNVPQLPFSHFELSFRQGQRSPLITPPTCGTYAVKATMFPWSDPGQAFERESSFKITQGPEGQGCPSGGVPPFHPDLLAGSENPTAGAYSPFYTEITRRDSEQEITRFSIKLPPGVIGKLAGVGTCSDPQIAAAKAREREGGGGEEEASPSCPANSQIGHSNVGSGVGNVLAYAPGKLYLAGPYHGSPISIVSVTAAKVGPFDLGTVVVRFALNIDHETAEVSVDGANSDPIPHIVDGIPVHLRDIQAFVDRKDFTLNPTSCAKKSTASTVLGSGLNFVSSSDDVPVTVSSPFQVGSCASLGFKPKLALSLKGGTKRSKNPAFKAVVTYPKQGNYANIRKSVVTLPSSEFLDNSHIGTICTRPVFNAGAVPGEKCPKASVYGFAKATTPLLDEPISGPVYLRANGGERNLPDLVAALHSGQININLVGFIDAVHKKGSEISRIRNTFAAVPDAPVTKFTLEMKGGDKGLLVNSTNLCKGSHRAISEFTGQNGKLYDTNPELKAQCGKSKHKRASRSQGGGR